jgi:hypothetical protein
VDRHTDRPPGRRRFALPVRKALSVVFIGMVFASRASHNPLRG